MAINEEGIKFINYKLFRWCWCYFHISTCQFGFKDS